MVPSAQRNWILIRGLARGVGHWGDFSKLFEKSFSEDKIYYVDIPGNGYLNHIKTPLKISEFIPFFEKQLRQQNFNANLPTYGYSLSLGSMAMVEWARQKPDFFSQIYISNTSAGNFSNIFKRLSYKAILLGMKISHLQDIRQKELAALLITTSMSKEQIEQSHQQQLSSIVKYSQEYPTHPKNILRQLIAASIFYFPREAPTEVILMSGLKDQFVSPSCTVDIEKHWKCRHHKHPTAGHDISMQDPEWVIEKIKLGLTPSQYN